MRKFCAFLLLSLIPFFSAHAALYLVVTTQEKSYFGEYIESYEDRWFYEEATPETPRYLLLFAREQFHFIPKEAIKSYSLVNIAPSRYKEFLRDNDLFFKNELVENAHVLTGNEGHHKFEKMFGNFAWDIGILDELGRQHKDEGNHLEDYYVYEQEVRSPLKGTVVGKVDGQEDNPPDLSFSSSLAGKINNYLTIQVHPVVYLSIVHFKKNTIKVEVGDQVDVDQPLGEVGNSGVSYLPHLHYTLYTYIPQYKRFISIPGHFEGR